MTESRKRQKNRLRAQALRGEAAVRDFALEHEVELPRMADAALWVESAAPALGWGPGVLLKLFLENQAEVQRHIVPIMWLRRSSA